MAYALLTDLSGKPLKVFLVNEPYDCKGEFKLKKRFRTANMLRDEIVYPGGNIYYGVTPVLFCLSQVSIHQIFTFRRQREKCQKFLNHFEKRIAKFMKNFYIKIEKINFKFHFASQSVLIKLSVIFLKEKFLITDIVDNRHYEVR